VRSESLAYGTRLGPRLVGSLVAHGLVVFVLSFWPTSAPPALPVMVTVDLVASVPTPAPPRAPVRPPPPAAAPKPVQKKVVLPKKAPALKPKPKPVKRPARVERPRRKPVADELEYEDALDLLRKELGEERPEPEEAAAEPTAAAPPSEGAVRASPEWTAWQSAARRHVRRRWVMPSEFLDRSLSTALSVELSADGQVVGTPRVTRSSGDPFWDDNTVRAILSASPLPPPPAAGEWPFVFTPEERF
jgi:TonB family protein